MYKSILTPKEKEVMILIAHGKHKSEIAQSLKICESTVKRHCEHIFSKLDVNNLHGAVGEAFRKGLIQ